MSEWTSIAQPMHYIVELDAPLTVRQERGKLVQGDKNANAFVLAVYQTKGVTADLTGCTASLVFVRPDKYAIVNSAEITGNVITATLKEGCYAYSGSYAADVNLSKDGIDRTILRTTGSLISTENSGVVDDEQLFPSPEELLDTLLQVEQARDSANAAASRANTAAARAEQLKIDASGLAGDSNKLGGKAPEYYNHDYYEGQNLKTVFGNAAELHAAVAAGDLSGIRVGDYWPITLSGTIYDYASGSEKTLNNATLNMEVAGVNFYLQYGDTGVPNHLLFCSRDLLPWALMFRSENTTWYDAEATNPWLGSHLYQTLNNPSNGLLPLVAATDIGAYIYAGPNGNGMRFFGETKGPTATTATDWAWADRGKLFLPSEREVWGGDTWSEHGYGGGLALQWPIFAGTMRHIIKGLGNGGSPYRWWCCSSHAGSSGVVCDVTDGGLPDNNSATNAWVGAPVCFLFS